MAFQTKRSVKKLFKDKGFYVALALCVVALGLVAVAGISTTLPKKGNDEPSPDVTTTTTAPSTQGAQNPVSNVPDLRTTASTAPTTTPTTAPPAPQDLYVLPLTNMVSAPYSEGKLAYSKTMADWRVHNGVDFVGETGQTVKAAAKGQIKVIRTDEMWGDVIEIDHGFGIVTRYCGVSARGVAVGDAVDVGEEIGVLSPVPCEIAEPPHLHLEVLSGGKYLDAVAVIGVDTRLYDD